MNHKLSVFNYPALAISLLVSLLLSQTLLADESHFVMLQYHHIGSNTPPVTSISVERFREHMLYLQENQFTVLPLEEAINSLQSGAQLPDKSAVITFDDGYLSVFDAAFPILQELGFDFTVFITAGLVSSNSSLYASWEQLREMGKAGATLANHSVTHPYMLAHNAGESDAQWLQRLTHEIEEAELIIARETGQNHKLFAYPYGEYDPSIEALVRSLGYIGIGQHSGPVNANSDFTALPRFPFSGIYSALNTYMVKVNTLAFNVRIQNPTSPVTTELSPSAVLDFDGSYRLDALSCFNNNDPMEIKLLNAQEQQYQISTTIQNKSRRFRYNCTAPGRNGRYHWVSIPWVNPSVPE